jgi:hypothetical protein
MTMKLTFLIAVSILISSLSLNTDAKFISKLKNENDDNLVQFTLYYESLCPDCRGK